MCKRSCVGFADLFRLPTILTLLVAAKSCSTPNSSEGITFQNWLWGILEGHTGSAVTSLTSEESGRDLFLMTLRKVHKAIWLFP